jgi:hypothetical protein
MPQIGEFANVIHETSMFGVTPFISFLAVGVFTLFNCGLITTQDISIILMPQIGNSPTRIRETSKFGAIGPIHMLYALHS